MNTVSDFPVGTKVKFTPGRARYPVEAEVIRHEAPWLVTKDAQGVERKTRAGACRKAA